MHHFIYPSQDTYISNKSTEIDKNFGLDELLVVGVSQSYAKQVNNYKQYNFNNEYVAGMGFENFSGSFTGSAFLHAATSSGQIVGGYNVFNTSYFSGSLTGSLTGYETGSSFTSFDFSGSLIGFSGQIVSNAINGWVSSSLTTTCFNVFTGALTNATGSLTGYLTGTETKYEMNTRVVLRKYLNRALLKFDLTTTSQSIVSGEITDPKFYLKMYVVEARELPIEYQIFVFPISQSWVQGDGYFSDEGSNTGASWNYRNKYSGSTWFSPYRTDLLTSSVDYLGNHNYASESFIRGGGTWYNIPCSKSYSYESADINLEITPIVNAWLNNTISNDGLILMCSEETNISGSNAHIFFFGKETNTIYSPHLDIAWDDQTFITGSFGTGSVITEIISPRISGSMTNGITITNFLWTGSIGGFCGLTLNSNGQILSSSFLDMGGKDGTIQGVDIRGSISGTSSFADSSGSIPISCVINTGDFIGCYVNGVVKNAIISGNLSGSFHEMLFLNHEISGSISSSQNVLSYVSEYSPVPGILVGNVSNGISNSGTFEGIFKSGLLTGATATIPFTGSNCFVTSSILTTTVNITSSAFQLINENKPFVVIIQDLKPEYEFGDMPRINIFARETYPLKTFGKALQQPVYVTPRLLPSSSFYSISDNETEEVIVDFDNYTKISCDLNGHFFVLNTTAFEVERYYKVLIKVEFDDGKQYTFDNNNVFKIRR